MSATTTTPPNVPTVTLAAPFWSLTEVEQVGTLESSLYPGAKRESILAVLAYCRGANLDPMLRPVHIVPMNVCVKVAGKPDRWEWRDVILPGLNLYRVMAAQTGDYAGKSDAEFGPMVQHTFGSGNAAITIEIPTWCRVTVRRFVRGVVCDFVATEWFLENYATAGKDTDRPNTMWFKRRRGQLAKCTEAQALRMAFPERCGDKTFEEMEGKTIDGEAEDITDATAEKPRVKAKPRAAPKLDAFANAEKAPPEVAEPEPEPEPKAPATPQPTIEGVPAMSLAAYSSLQDGRWGPAWVWISEILPMVPAVEKRQQVVNAHADLLRKASTHSPKTKAAVDALLQSCGVTLG